jgi:hypothetical protein
MDYNGGQPIDGTDGLKPVRSAGASGCIACPGYHLDCPQGHLRNDRCSRCLSVPHIISSGSQSMGD